MSGGESERERGEREREREMGGGRDYLQTAKINNLKESSKSEEQAGESLNRNWKVMNFGSCNYYTYRYGNFNLSK